MSFFIRFHHSNIFIYFVKSLYSIHSKKSSTDMFLNLIRQFPLRRLLSFLITSLFNSITKQNSLNCTYTNGEIFTRLNIRIFLIFSFFSLIILQLQQEVIFSRIHYTHHSRLNFKQTTRYILYWQDINQQHSYYKHAFV